MAARSDLGIPASRNWPTPQASQGACHVGLGRPARRCAELGALDWLRPLLDGLTGTGPVEVTDADGTWSVYTANQNLTGPLALDPRTGAFSSSSGATGTPIEFRDPNVSGRGRPAPHRSRRDPRRRLARHSRRPVGRRPHRRSCAAPSSTRRDSFGPTRPSRPSPSSCPALRIRVQQLAGDSVGVKLLSASTSGPPVDNIYEFIRMEPAHALIGPGRHDRLRFRTAVLDLSGTAGPSGVPPTARVMPADWQGLYLPEVRLFVAPNGVEGLAVSAGRTRPVDRHRRARGRDRVVRGGGRQSRRRADDQRPLPHRERRVHRRSGRRAPHSFPSTPRCSSTPAAGIAPISITIVVDGVSTSDDRVEVTTPATGSITITVTARTVPRARHVADVHREPAGRAGVSSGSGDGEVTVTPTRQDTHRIVREAVSPTTVTVRLEPRASVTWTWPGGSHTGETAEIPATSAAPVVVTATFAAAERQTADCYFLFDHPWPSEGDDYALNPLKTHTGPAASRDTASASTMFIDSMRDRLTLIGAGTQLIVDGYASFEGPSHNAPPDIQHNLDLSRRRQAAAITILNDLGYTNVSPGAVHGHADARDQIPIVAGGPTPAPGASGWWLARVYTNVPAAAEVCTAEIRRRAAAPPAAVDPTPPPRGRPDVFRKIGVRVEFVRSTFIRGEIYGEFDIETATESALARNGQPALRNGPRNPSDGICLFLLRLRLERGPRCVGGHGGVPGDRCRPRRSREDGRGAREPGRPRHPRRAQHHGAAVRIRHRPLARRGRGRRARQRRRRRERSHPHPLR